MDLPDGTWQGFPYFITACLGTSVKSYMAEHMNTSTVPIKKVATISMILVLRQCLSYASHDNVEKNIWLLLHKNRVTYI